MKTEEEINMYYMVVKYFLENISKKEVKIEEKTIYLNKLLFEIFGWYTFEDSIEQLQNLKSVLEWITIN